jgi:hypothetical protein
LEEKSLATDETQMDTDEEKKFHRGDTEKEEKKLFRKEEKS